VCWRGCLVVLQAADLLELFFAKLTDSCFVSAAGTTPPPSHAVVTCM